MRVLVQWSLAHPRDWDEVHSSCWTDLPFKLEPQGGESFDDEPGWITAINIQGVNFDGYDHYAVVPLEKDHGEALLVYAWCDDPKDWEEEYGSKWMFRTLKPDPEFNGHYNTRQSGTRFVKGNRLKRTLEGPPPAGPFNHLHWDRWKNPPKETIRHGIWIPDSLHDAHQAIQSKVGWQTWLEGVDVLSVKDGKAF